MIGEFGETESVIANEVSIQSIICKFVIVNASNSLRVLLWIRILCVRPCLNLLKPLENSITDGRSGDTPTVCYFQYFNGVFSIIMIPFQRFISIDSFISECPKWNNRVCVSVVLWSCVPRWKWKPLYWNWTVGNRWSTECWRFSTVSPKIRAHESTSSREYSTELIIILNS